MSSGEITLQSLLKAREIDVPKGELGNGGEIGGVRGGHSHGDTWPHHASAGQRRWLGVDAATDGEEVG